MPPLHLYKPIREIGEKYGVTHRLLRFYEEQGFLKPVREGERRHFTPEDEKVLSMILQAKRLGLTLKEIGRLLKRGETHIEVDVDTLAERAGIFEADAREKAKIAEHIRATLSCQTGDVIVIGDAA